MTENLAIVILAAGAGTRMKSERAKVLHRAGGKTLIELVVATASRLAPAGSIYVVVGYKADQVRETLDGRGVKFVVQRQQLGTGHAVLACRRVFEKGAKRVLLLYGDCPLISAETLQGLVDRHRASGAAATVLTAEIADPAAYGRIVRGPSGRLEAIVELKAATAEQRAIREINSGIYCFETRDLFRSLRALKPNRASGEYYLTDVIAELASHGKTVETVVAEEPCQALGINTRIELALVDSLLRIRKAEQLMLEGVTIQRPETVTLDQDVRIGPDTLLEPFVQVLGRSAIGKGCLIRSYSMISDSTVADNVVVEPFSLLHGSKVEAGARIGPYARLRAGNRIGRGAQIGNFVELKKTRLGARSKAMHLAYLGDSTIGARVNIGAGTITCNFDGVAKHPTTIQDGAFVGSNATLVAPVEVGKDAYIAAGSVITENLPPKALGIGRARQTTKPGWVKRKRVGRASARAGL